MVSPLSFSTFFSSAWAGAAIKKHRASKGSQWRTCRIRDLAQTMRQSSVALASTAQAALRWRRASALAPPETCTLLDPENNTHDQAEERCPFEKGGDDKHGGLHLTCGFGLASHAFQGRGADFAEAEARAQDS